MWECEELFSRTFFLFWQKKKLCFFLLKIRPADSLNRIFNKSQEMSAKLWMNVRLPEKLLYIRQTLRRHFVDFSLQFVMVSKVLVLLVGKWLSVRYILILNEERIKVEVEDVKVYYFLFQFQSYLLTWKLILTLMSKASAELRSRYSAFLRQNNSLKPLMETLFHVMPKHVSKIPIDVITYRISYKWYVILV